MRAKVFTLRFSSQLGRFDDGELIALQRRVVLEHLREHVITTAGETMLACVATWQERTGSTAANDSPPPRTDDPSTTPPPRHEAAADPDPTTATQPPGPATPLDQLRAEFTDEQRNLFDLVRRWRAHTAHDEAAPARNQQPRSVHRTAVHHPSLQLAVAEGSGESPVPAVLQQSLDKPLQELHAGVWRR